MRNIPDIPTELIEDYALNIGHNFDTVKETFNVVVPEQFMVEMTQVKAHEMDKHDKKTGVPVTFGGEDMFMSPKTGGGGTQFYLYNDDFRVFIRSPEMEWCVSIEYSSAGLWEYGLMPLRERAIEAMLKEFSPKCEKSLWDDEKQWQRLSRADYAFDFYSPEFSKDMKPEIMTGIVCPSGSKKRCDFKVDASAIGSGVRIETLTIGKINRLQVQIYDKGREITDMSGKTWMLKHWQKNGYYPPSDKSLKDIWRLEIRFGKDLLRNRKVLTLYDFLDLLPALLAEGIFSRRLTVETVGDSNRSRWGLHPLFVSAYVLLGDVTAFAPVGKQETMTREAKAEQMKTMIAGCLRNLTILAVGDMDDMEAEKLVKQAYDIMLSDPEHEAKLEKIRRRHALVDEAV